MREHSDQRIAYDYLAPIIATPSRHGADADAMGHAAMAHRRTIGYEHPQHVAALAWLAQAGRRYLLPFNSFAETCASPTPRPRRMSSGCVERRPTTDSLRWYLDRFEDDRGAGPKLVPGPDLEYGFSTTPPNAVVEPINRRAMPVILRRRGSATSGSRAIGWGEGAAAAVADAVPTRTRRPRNPHCRDLSVGEPKGPAWGIELGPCGGYSSKKPGRKRC